MPRAKYWLDLGQHPDEEAIEEMVGALGRRFAVRYTTDRLGNGRLDLVSIPWPRNIFLSGRQVRERLVELLDEGFPGWSNRYTLQPLRTNAEYEWIQSTAEAVFEYEVVIEEGKPDPAGIDAARKRLARAYAEAAERGLAAAVQRQVSAKHDARAWRIRNSGRTTRFRKA